MADLPNIRNISNDLSSARTTMNVARQQRTPAGRAGDVRQAITNYSNQLSGTGILEFLNDRPKYYCSLKMGSYNRSDLLNVSLGSISTTNHIILPLPQMLVDNHEIAYTETPLGWGAGGAIQGAGNLFNNNQETSLGGVIGQIGAGVAGAGGQSVAENVPGFQTAQNAAQAVLGFAPNQFFTVLLRGPQYKRHKLRFSLLPRDYSESRKLREIIRVLNNAAAPSLHLGGTVFGFPFIFEIALAPNHLYLYRFKPACLESIVVDYTPRGMPAFYNNNAGGGRGNSAANNPPESVTIELNFLELEYWLRNDFKEGGPADDVTASVSERQSDAPQRFNTVTEGVQTGTEFFNALNQDLMSKLSQALGIKNDTLPSETPPINQTNVGRENG